MLEIGNIKVPFARMGVIIGKEGTVKARIEEEGKVRLDIDSENATVTIFQKNDPLKALMAMNAVQAIARGFNPEKAMLLFDDSVQLIVISIKEFVNKDAKRIKEIRGRLIGKEGHRKSIPILKVSEIPEFMPRSPMVSTKTFFLCPILGLPGVRLHR